VSCAALSHERRDGGIAGKAAVPVGLAVDLDSLEHGRQAGRRQQDLGRQLGVAEDATAAGTHVGRRDEELDGRLHQPLEVDARLENGSQRVVPAWIEIVGREDPRHEVERDEGRGGVERPPAKQAIERRALQRAERRG